MHRFGAEVEQSLKAAREAGQKVSVFDDHGCLLWFCQDWETEVGSMERWAQALGSGWLEFIHEEDVAIVRDWIKIRGPATVRFRSVHSHGQGWQEVVLTKRRVGLYWVAVGERGAEGPELPGTSCVLISLALAAVQTMGAAADAALAVRANPA